MSAPTRISLSSADGASAASNADVLKSCQASDSGNLYVVGCLERRVTLYSQQVRALNLVSALLDEGRITRETKIAVVGGGAAGLTAAAAIALAIPAVQTLDILERKPEPLHLQLRSPDRYLHPHLYDWPQPGSREPAAGLPVLDWTAGSAGEVASQLLAEFERVTAPTRLQLRTDHRVERIEEFAPGMGCRLRVAGHSAAGYRYDVCLLSIGFGNELLSDNERNFPYWDANRTAAPLRGAADSQSIFVSGNGDGGLVDFMIAAFDGRSHAEILSLVTARDDLAEAERVLMEIEAEAWRPDSALDIESEYQRRLRPVLPHTLLPDVGRALRRNANVLLHTRESQLFRKETAVLNRFIVFLAFEADRARGEYALRRSTGHEISNDPLDPVLRLTDGTPVRPDRRYLRFGTDTAAHHAPFKGHLDTFAARRPAAPGFYRPATPLLTASARARFPAAPSGATAADGATASTIAVAPAAQPPVAGVRDHGTAPRAETLLRLSKAPNGHVHWRSTIPSAEARRLWSDGVPPILLRCEMTPEEAGPLRYAVARLIAHARDYRLVCQNSHAWTQFLRAFYGEKRPGPAVEFRFAARLCVDEMADDDPAEEASLYELASRIHLSLDHDVLARLHAMLERGLGPQATVTAGWQLESGLRATMAIRWREWHTRLLESDAQRRRFLTLLVSPDDDTDIGPAGLVRVGPKCVEAHLLRAALLALAFSISTEPGLQPCASFPGNLGVPPLSAHALGVSWLDGVDVGPGAAERAWSTDVVLLSELQVAPLHPPVLPRLDHADVATESVRGIPAHEQALVLGCTQAVRAALAIGESAVRTHFTNVLREHARAAARAIG